MPPCGKSGTYRVNWIETMDKMETSLLSNQEITSLFETCMWYYNCPLDPLFGSTIKVLDDPL